MTIAMTAFKEKIRRKELYIVSAIGIVVLLIFGTGTGTLSIDGVAITDYTMLAPILLVVLNALACILAFITSFSTIPNEYERRTSHLVWIRNVSQARYHGELTLANILAGLVSEAILFVVLFIFMLTNGRVAELWRLIPVYLIIAINVVIVSTLTGMLSIVIPKTFAASISVVATLVGIFHGLLYLLKDVIGGFGGMLVKYVLKILPDLHSIQSQAGNVLCGRDFDIHTILVGLLFAYIFTVLILVLKRKEA